MSRLLFCSLALCAVTTGGVLMTRITAQQPPAPGAPKRDEGKEFIEKFRKTFYEPLRIQESKPVTVNEAQFVTVAQTQWIPGKPWSDSTAEIKCNFAPLDLQLRITNLARSAVLFPTVNSFGVRLFDAAGKEVKARDHRNGTSITRPALLPAGAPYSLWRRAELHWDEKAKASELVYYDGTGAQSSIGPLAAGRYKLVFWYMVGPEKGAPRKSGAVATWAGEVVTEAVTIEILNETARGLMSETVELNFPRSLKRVSEVLRIRESKPVTVKGVRFVLAAECEWKAGKGSVPIDIQLRITNLSQEDMLFHTFDTFGFVIKDRDGKRMMTRGGRDITYFTRPLLIPKGASYSLCRKAELRWNAEDKANELFYSDGTGSEVVYGPFGPGQYKLAFWYGVSSNPPLKGLLRPERKKGDPMTWIGEVVTEELVIDVRDR